MEYGLVQQPDGTWVLTRNGDPVGAPHPTQGDALDALGLELAAGAVAAQELAIDAEAGLLPEEWVSPVMAITAATGPSRDFSEVTWESLDPGAVFMPLMLSTTNEGGGHYGARLAGYFTQVTLGETPSGRGRFYDNEAGREFRDLLLGDRRYAVSVDPTENVEYEIQCVELDDDGWCLQERVSFTRYEIGGMTGVPFAGFSGGGDQPEGAYIVLATAPAATEEREDAAAPPSEDDTADEPDEEMAAAGAAPCCESCAARAAAAGPARVAARESRAVTAAGGPVAPPADWFEDPMLDRLTPLTITDDGRVFGHLAPWGQCHTGSQPGSCTVTPRSASAYAYFRTGYVVCDDGTEVATGRLTLGGGHADLHLSYRGAVEHYDNAGAAIADLAAGEDAFGVWCAGALRPGVTAEQVRAARASSPSGDWRPVGAGLEMVAALCVNQPGFPIARVASGRVLALVAAGASQLAAVAADPMEDRIAALEARLSAMHAELTAPARARLAASQRETVRKRLAALR